MIVFQRFNKYRCLPAAFIALCLVLLPFSSPCLATENCLAKQVLTEINLARENPRGYAGYLRQFRRQFRGRSYLLPGTHTLVQTSEGAKAVDEAIRFLSRQKPLPLLGWSQGLAEAAAELADEEGKSGAVGHQGSSSGGPRERIERHGQWQGTIGEDIFYGTGDARQAVMNLIIDDGVPGRGHRKNIYTRAFALAGADCAPHPAFRTICVIDFAGEFLE